MADACAVSASTLPGPAYSHRPGNSGVAKRVTTNSRRRPWQVGVCGATGEEGGRLQRKADRDGREAEHGAGMTPLSGELGPYVPGGRGVSVEPPCLGWQQVVV
jgi:hypothetical protein